MVDEEALNEREFEIMQGYDESIVEYYREMESHNKSILELVGSEYGPKILKKVEKFLKQEEGDCIIGKMKIVDKCYGDKNKGGGFGFYYVVQRSQGMEGDSWSGEFYLPLPGGKFLEICFEM